MIAHALTLAALLAAPAAQPARPAAPATAPSVQPVQPAPPAAAPAVEKAPAADPAQLAASVRAHTDQLIAAFKRVQEDDGKLSAAAKATNAQAYAELDALLARDHFTAIAIAPRAAKFGAAELATFKAQFWDVVQRIAYPGSGAFFREGEVKIAAPTLAGEVWTIELTAYVPSEDLTTVVGLQWQAEGDKLRIVDVLFDGDSLVRDYQNQFARIVDKDGAAGLLKALADKRAELMKKAEPAQ